MVGRTMASSDHRLCGGQVRPGDAACYGAQAESFFTQFYADKAFLGSGGVHARAGLTDYYPPEVVTRRTIIAHSAASYVLADSSKLGAIAVHRVCPLDRVTAVLTDHQASPEVTEALADAGCAILQAVPPGHGGRGGLGGTAASPRAARGDGSHQEMDQWGSGGDRPPNETER
jgi:DeoR/GlpR family transcriptional regulator of sugar metabolism